jgi:DNA-directed RNA polymerase II subunit RPB1
LSILVYIDVFHQSNPKFIKARKQRDSKARLRAVWDICKSKMICEGGDDMDLDGLDDEGMIEGEDGEMKRRKPHGGCGHKQPVIRKEGLKLFYAYRSGGGDVSILFSDHVSDQNLIIY